jgi:hypothetical protein
LKIQFFFGLKNYSIIKDKKQNYGHYCRVETLEEHGKKVGEQIHHFSLTLSSFLSDTSNVNEKQSTIKNGKEVRLFYLYIW